MPELAAWLFDKIEKTTEPEALDYIGEVIAFDKGVDADYLANHQVVGILRRAWAEKQYELSRTRKGESEKYYS